MSQGTSNPDARQSAPRLRMAGIHKNFGSTAALSGVSFEVGTGEVHALIGENGAGKSTLMKVLSGAIRADQGSIQLDGKEFVPQNPLHTRRSGIAMIYQELSLAPHLTVAENILLGTEPHTFGWLRRTEREQLAHAALAELNHDSIPLNAKVSTLTIAEQQVVEIARALIGDPRVIIMDEPTSSLTSVDSERLFEAIGKLAKRGVSIVYISHFLEECQRICDRYTVLRDGQSVGSGSLDDIEIDQMIHLMVGREIKDVYPRHAHELGEPLLEIENLAGRDKPSQVSLTLRAGEILGIAGLVGAGRTETLRSVFGLDPVTAGTVRVTGSELGRFTPSSRLDQGIGLLSEDRKEEGLMLNRDLAENLTLTSMSSFSWLGFVNRRKQHTMTDEWMKRLDVRASGSNQVIGDLSGGNQQKIAIGRLLHHDAQILLLDEPTRGIDVGSKVHIYKLIDELADAGKAVIFVSSYMPELIGVCDTIGVMCRGTLTEIRPTEEWTEHEIITAALGHSEAATP